MADVPEQLANIRGRIAAACAAAGRAVDEVTLVAVSKTFPAATVMLAVDAGQRVFGESRLQEAEPKLTELPPDLVWHFIGRVQSNKVRKILPLFPVVHGIDSARLAEHVDRIAGELGLTPRVFLQVNIGREASKGGFDPDEVLGALPGLQDLKHLRIEGLMCIPPAVEDPEDARPWFAAMRELRDSLRQRSGMALPALSMGMSHDFEQAILEGATHVRVGSAIFGERSYRVDGELG